MRNISDRDVRVRKPRTCYSCLETFPAGTTMRCATYKDDNIYTLYSCASCEALLAKMLKADPYFDSEGLERGWAKEAKR